MRAYDKTKRRHADVYSDRRWLKLTAMCKARFNGLDVYALMVDRKIVYGTMSHHIVPVEDNKDMAFDINNLVYLSEGTHKKIHAMYRESEEKKRQTQEVLRWCVSTYIEMPSAN